ncbi:DUF6975 family protein [Sphingobium aquiterrae]|uniref:DUF6975 family protein n=1 Tax=Sphingobium aquiterrae TaxID=2038656 RepID=UPI00301A48AE
MRETVELRNDGPGSGPGVAEVLSSLVMVEGTPDHPHAAGFAERSPADLTDAIHYLCVLHGRHPGVIDHAAVRSADNAARQWLVQAIEGFAAERAYLTRIAVAAGPVPSTAGQSDCDATVLGQRHALDMLAQSDRRGCAIGAAFALILDWGAIRPMLDRVALRLELEPHATMLPPRNETLAVADALATEPAVLRAVLFGAGQLVRQHRGLWDLLQARAAIRAGN